MKINSIEWHKENLKNMRIHAEEKRKDVVRSILEHERQIYACNKLELQIASAELSGKETFDAERYLKKRVEKAR